MGDPANFNLGEVVTLKAGEAINSNYSVMRELVGGAWELEPDQFVDVSKTAYHDQAVMGKAFLLWVVDKILVTVVSLLSYRHLMPNQPFLIVSKRRHISAECRYK